MGAGLLVCRLALAAVFAIAGAAKLADRRGFRTTVVEFGVSERLTVIAATALPTAEIAVALALIVTQAARYGAAGGGLLLLTFSAAIVNARLHGKAPDCRCFGQLHSAPVGWPALARNLVLFGVATFVVVAGWHSPGDSATAWVTTVSTAGLGMIGAGVVVALVIAFQIWFSLQLLGQNGRMLARVEALERTLGALAQSGGPESAAAAMPAIRSLAELPGGGLPVGTAAPRFELDSIRGRRQSLDSLLAGNRPLMLIFSTTGCGPCNALLPQIASWQREHRQRLQVAVISSGDRDRISVKAAEHGLDHVLLEGKPKVADAYGANGTPMAVLIGTDGLIRSRTVGGAEVIKQLLELAASGPPPVRGTPGPLLPVKQYPAAPNGQPAPNGNRNGTAPPMTKVADIGAPAPELALTDLSGKPTALKDLFGEPLLVIFWNPACGFCERMLPDLRALEDASDPPAAAPRLLVISTGDPNRLREQQIRSRLLLDPEGRAMREFRANGTPMAVLIDERGQVASPVLAGGPAVLAAARGEPHPVGAG